MRRREDQKQYDRTVAGNWPEKAEMITGPVYKAMDLKYARNPGYTGALYLHEGVEGPSIGTLRVVKAGKDPGYINLEDVSRAIRTTRKLHDVFPGYVIASVVKHEIP